MALDRRKRTPQAMRPAKPLPEQKSAVSRLEAYGDRIIQSLTEGEETLRSVAHYELVRQLGEGGMGTVFLAHQVSEGDIRKPVAVKILKDTHDPKSIESFIHEARLLASLTQGTIVELLALESKELRLAGRRNARTGRIEPPRATKLYFMVQEFVDGPSFDDVLRKHRDNSLVMDPAMVGFIINKSVIALAEAHTLSDDSGRPLNLVHRDISPSNILIASKAGITKLADFGVAKAFADFAEGKVDEKRQIVGKPKYMSPEQLNGVAMAASDIWSLGVIAYEALTGYAPYRLYGKSMPEIVKNLKAQFDFPLRSPAQIIQPSSAVYDLSVISNMVMQCLQKDPEQRPSAAALNRILEADYLYGQGLGPTNKTLAAYLRLLECALGQGEVIPPPDYGTSEDAEVLCRTLRIEKPLLSMRKRSASAYQRDFLIAVKNKHPNPCLEARGTEVFQPEVEPVTVE